MRALKKKLGNIDAGKPKNVLVSNNNFPITSNTNHNAMPIENPRKKNKNFKVKFRSVVIKCEQDGLVNLNTVAYDKMKRMKHKK